MHHLCFKHCLSVASFLQILVVIYQRAEKKKIHLGDILVPKPNIRLSLRFFLVWNIHKASGIYPPLVLPEQTSQHENCKGLHVSSLLSHTFTSSPSPGLSGSMNFDETSEHEDEEEERTRSLSPNASTTRPSSAASGKDVPVSSTHQQASNSNCKILTPD